MKKVLLLVRPDQERSPGRLRVLLLVLLALSFSLSTLHAQTLVKGKVSDENGAGMPGVNILIKGTPAGTATDANGDYALSVPADVTTPLIVFSYIGYETQEIPLQGRTTLDVKMVTDSKQLTEVVVVGYGTQLKRDITGAILTVSQETLQQTASSNVIDQLKGHAAGVDITSNSSVPGGGGGQIRIRGNRTMISSTQSNTSPQTGALDAANADAADQPLLVVDGIPYSGNLNDISPGDIASLEILKDASATAIYGSRGAGGVILITTKRGQKGKVQVSYDAYYGFSQIMGEMKVYNGPQYAQLKADAAAGNSISPNTNGYALTTQEQAALQAGVSTDWQKLIYQKGPITNHNLSVSGGNETSRYSLSGGYFKQDGIIPNQDFTRYSIRSTMDHQIGKRIRLGLNTLNTLSYQNLPGGSGVPVGLMRLTPLASPYNPDGSINLLPQVGQTDNAVVSPLTLKSKSDAVLARNRRLRTFNSFYTEIDIIKGLKYRANIGLDYSQEVDNSYSGSSTYVNTSPSPAQSMASIRNFETFQYTVENLLLYEKTFAEKHKIGFTGLYSFQKIHQQNSGMFALGLPADYMQNANLGLATSVYAINPTNPNDNPNQFLERGLISYMARLNYSFENRFSATVTVRRDGSSILSPGNQYFNYPAFAGAWNISNEQFMSAVPVISNLKLRAGWGVTAIQSLNPYSTLGALSPYFYNFGVGSTGQQPGYLVTSLPNHALKWESTAQDNFGLDFGFFRNRLTGAFEVYSQQTKNIILPESLPASNGASTAFVNVGKTKSHGMELSLSSVNLRTDRGLVWTTDFNYFFNREKIVSLTAPGQTSDIGNGWFVGQPLTVIYDYKKLGIWQTGDAGLASQTSPVQHPGQIHVQDVDGDGKITAADRQILGNFQPKFDAGLTNRVSYKRIDLSVSMYARMGMKVLVPYLSSDANGSNNGYSFFMQSRNNQLKVDYWTPTHPTNAFPQPDASLGAPQYSSTLSYVDGSFIKIRTINLGYDLPTAPLAKMGITSLHIYISVVNPFVLYSPFVKAGYGPDPEGNGYGGGVMVNGTTNSGAPGHQISVNANNPSTRQFLCGLNLKF
jgi:TonB-linked SusC/RagA family outer membrane protein